MGFMEFCSTLDLYLKKVQRLNEQYDKLAKKGNYGD